MIYPAIDLRAGSSIRLYQGNYQKPTLVNADPIDQAKSIRTSGIQNLHLVDLDGAKDGLPTNVELAKQIAAIIDGQTEIGGGIRNEATIEMYLANGLSRVILGSVALKDPAFTTAMIQKYGSEHITIGVDGANGMVATEGWVEQSNVKMATLINKMASVGANRFIITDTKTDGTLSGPNLDLLGSLKHQFPELTLVASGGIRDLSDVIKLKSIGIDDVIIGQAIADQKVTLKEVAEANKC